MLEEQLVLLSNRGPVLVVFEDAHWIDPTSLELMNRVIRRVADLPVMIIVTYRPEFTPPWLDLGHVTVLKLNLLGRSQVVDLIHKRRRQDAARGDRRADRRQVAGCPAIYRGNHAVDFGIRRSGRTPRPLRLATINSRIHHSVYVAGLLIARLDRLGSAKDVVLTASIIGREFSYELIKAISSVSQATLLADLGRLVQSDLLGQRGVHHNRATSSSMR